MDFFAVKPAVNFSFGSLCLTGATFTKHPIRIAHFMLYLFQN